MNQAGHPERSEGPMHFACSVQRPRAV